MRLVHKVRRTYNDLKPENVMLNIHENNRPQVYLIDFGFTDRFIKEGSMEHNEKERTQYFKGNLNFSSVYQMNFLKTSRRDDMISLYYMMVVMFNGERFPKEKNIRNHGSPQQFFQDMKRYKQ